MACSSGVGLSVRPASNRILINILSKLCRRNVVNVVLCEFCNNYYWYHFKYGTISSKDYNTENWQLSSCLVGDSNNHLVLGDGGGDSSEICTLKSEIESLNKIIEIFK